MEGTAKVIPWSSKPATRERPSTPSGVEMTNNPVDSGRRFEPLTDVVLWIPDEQLEALGTLFASSPLRKAMTFEGYLVVKGYGDARD